MQYLMFEELEKNMQPLQTS